MNKNEEEFFNAIRNNDIEKVKKLVENGVDVNAKDEKSYHYSGLLDALEYGGIEIVKYLVEKGADIDARDYNGHTALMIASKYGKLGIVEYLLEKLLEKETGINKDIFLNIITALMLAAENGKLRIVAYFIEKGIDINAKYYYGKTILMIVSERGHVEIVKYLVRNGANVNAQNNDGKTAFDLMVITGDSAIESLEYSIFLDKEEIEKRKEEIIKEAIEIGKVLRGIR